MTCIFRPFIVVLFTSALAAATQAFNIPSTEFTLSNGLQVIVIEDHRAPVVTHSVAYRVGSADEATGKTGLAHFFEHLLFKGTHKYPYGSFDRILDENGGGKNAFTTSDVTVYWESVSVDRLPLMMDLEADRMQNLVLTDDVINTERKVVQEERRQQTDSQPTAVMGEKLDAKLFTTHPYGRPVVGWPEDVAKLTREDVENFYRAHYTPANAIVLVVGDVKPDDVKKLAEKYYGPLANTVKPALRKRPEEPRHAAAQRFEMSDARVTNPMLYRKYIAPSYGMATARQASSLQILGVILGGGAQSRLYKNLVFTSKQATEASAWYAGDFMDYGSFGFVAVPVPGGNVQALEQAIDAEIEHVLKNGVTKQELEDAKNSVLADYVYQLDQPVGFGRMISIGLANGLSHEELYGRDGAVASVTQGDVLEAARLVLDITQSVTVVLKPQVQGANP